ncbi:unnamed protein product [Symbiodinium natans]|uniref:Uncharacterized protein n=1 Tax=Symbiodinium natans TaxID=878477 RepID=A0A812NYQ7_9DINO|nr:unnamed protein product [Symbiodinium natans]
MRNDHQKDFRNRAFVTGGKTGHGRQRSVDLNSVRSAAQGQGSMSASTTPPSTTPPSGLQAQPGEILLDFESKEAAEKELLMLRNVAAKKDQEWANLKLEAYRHRVIRKDSRKLVDELHMAQRQLLEEQEAAKEARAEAERWKAQVEQYRHQVEHLRASADKAAGLTKELKEAQAQQAALEVETKQWRATAEELRRKLEAVEKEREVDLQMHMQQAQSQLSPASHGPKVSASLNGHTPQKAPSAAQLTENFHERSAKAGRPRKNLRMVPMLNGSVELTPGSVTRYCDAPSSQGAAPSHPRSRELDEDVGALS